MQGNPFLRRNDRFFAKITWEELTRKPWVQTNYMPFEKYMGKRQASRLKKLHGPENPFEPTKWQRMTIEKIRGAKVIINQERETPHLNPLPARGEGNKMIPSPFGERESEGFEKGCNA